MEPGQTSDEETRAGERRRLRAAVRERLAEEVHPGILEPVIDVALTASRMLNQIGQPYAPVERALALLREVGVAVHEQPPPFVDRGAPWR